MASKVQIQKDLQGYNDKPKPAQCCACEHYASDMVKVKSRWGDTWTDEKNKRCNLGGFVVKKTATCNLHVPKGEL